MLPDELQTPPPRDLAAAGALFAKNRATVRALLIGIVLAPALLIGVLAVKSSMRGHAPVDALSIGLGLGLGGLVALFALAMWVQLERARRLYREGMATLGQVRRVEAPADRQGNAFVIVHVEFQDQHGKNHLGQCVTIGKQKENDRHEGDVVAVLYLADNPKRFCMYTPGLGMTAGVVR